MRVIKMTFKMIEFHSAYGTLFKATFGFIDLENALY